MARHLSVATAIEKNRIASATAFVVALKIDVRDPVSKGVVETIRVVNNAENLTIDGDLFTAIGFTMSINEKAGEIPSLTVEIDDLTRTVQGRMQLYKGGVGSDVTIYVVNTDALDEKPEYAEGFKITGASSTGYRVTWRLGIDNPLSLRFPRRRMFQNQCSFRYRGVECGYTGKLQTCDLSLSGPNGCEVHGNAARYGGFPALTNRSGF